MMKKKKEEEEERRLSQEREMLRKKFELEILKEEQVRKQKKWLRSDFCGQVTRSYFLW